MAHLALALLGPLQITLDGRLVTGFDYDKVRALLAYLMVEADRPHRRDALAGLLWPDQPDQVARNSLRQALATLRRAIGDQVAAVPFLHITREAVQFNRASDHDLDVVAFTTLLVACERHPHRHPETCASCARRLQEAVAQYRGEFLAQFYLPDSIPFEEWALVKREQLHRLILQALIQLADYHERRRDYARAERYLCGQLELDPWREEAHRQLMRVLAGRGQRSAALAQYERCCRALAEELGVEPMAETTALYERIRDAEGDASTASELLAHPSVHLHNLPAPTTPFVGREHELAELTDLIAKPACRLITLVGLGGVGKTRLALRAALDQIGAFTHGVYFVSLASLSSAMLLVPAIARALTFTFAGQEDPKEQLLRYLHEKELLLVLDNLEHLLAGAGLLTDILQHAPGVSILATSRERLNLHGEWVIEVAGLQVPEADQIEAIKEYSAVALFVQSACRAQADFALSAAEIPAVACICRLVAGMPLGIELAAAWLRVLSCAEIAREITQSMGFLTTALRDVPARHRSLRAVFDQSWRLLTDAEQCVFRKLSVFRGGFGREAGEQVAGASLPLLSGLVDKSLLHRNRAGRYELHELVRQYAGEKLQEAGEQGATRQRHADYYLRLAEELESHLHSSKQGTRLDRLEAEHDNLRAVLVWSKTAVGGLEIGLCLAAALGQFWHAHGHFSEGRAWLAEFLALTGNSTVSPNARAKALFGLGVLAQYQSDYTAARAAFEEALALSRELGEPRGIARALHELGCTTYYLSDYAAARSQLEQALVLWRELGDRPGIATTLHDLAHVAQFQGDYARALVLLEESESLYRELGDQRWIAWSIYYRGYVVLLQGDTTGAQRCFEEGLAIVRELGDKFGILWFQHRLGEVARYQGDATHAAQLYAESLAIARELGYQSGIGTMLNSLATAVQAQGDYMRAIDLHRQSLTIFRDLRQKFDIVLCLEGLAWVAGAQRQMERAAVLYGAVAAPRKAIGGPLPPVERAIYECSLTRVRAQLGEVAFAAAWTEGQAMSLEQAIAEALGEAAERPDM